MKWRRTHNLWRSRLSCVVIRLAQLPQLVVKSISRHTESHGSLGLVAAIACKRLEDEPAFIRGRARERVAPGARRDTRLRFYGANRQSVGRNLGAIAEEHRGLDHVGELAYVAGPF